MDKNQVPFPQQDNDPFHGQPTEEHLPWPSSTVTPRWQLLTQQEQIERDKQIEKLESKLKRLDRKKDKPMRKYTNEVIPDVSIIYSDNEEEDSHNEEEEGLPLLWKNKVLDVDQAPRKTEDQYNRWSLFSYYCCCFT